MAEAVASWHVADWCFATSSRKKSGGVLFNTLIIKFIFDFNPYEVKPSIRE